MTIEIDSTFDEAISRLTTKEELERQSAHESSGKLSAGMMAQPVLECVLKLIGVPAKEPEPYVLRKFARGNQAEKWFVEKLRAAMPDKTFTPQRKVEYRGGVGYQDISELDNGNFIPHEIKSVTNAKYKRIADGGWTRDSLGNRVRSEPGPDLGHAYQATWYGLAEEAPYFYIHYVAADDLRVKTFRVPTAMYAHTVRQHIDDVNEYLRRGALPAYIGFLGWHGMTDYSNYPQFVGLSGVEAEALLKELYPEQYTNLKKGATNG